MPMAPKVRFGGFLFTSEVLMLEIHDLWVKPAATDDSLLSAIQ